MRDFLNSRAVDMSGLVVDGNQADMNGIAGLMAFMGVLVVVLSILSIVLYVVQAIGLYGIAVNQGYDKPWLAWVPYANLFMFPILTNDDVHDFLRGRFPMMFGISLVVGIIGGMIFFPLALLPTFLMYYAFFFIADKYSERAVLHLVLSILTGGISMAFSLFAFRKRESLYA